MPARTSDAPREKPVSGAPTAIAVYGCEADEARLFRELAPRFGFAPAITADSVSAETIELARGHRCVSVGHKSRITKEHLSALGSVGVRYLSTRSIGYDHLDVAFAATVGISVGNVDYSPDSVADHTLMLMLMAVRDAKSVMRRADHHDYRLSDIRGRELRDLTVGVVGTGRIGAAVIDRLRAFRCRVIAHDRQQRCAVDYVSLERLLRLSDIVTLHTPLDAATHHLLDAERLSWMRRGAYVINTARGGLIDTEALVEALESGGLAGAALDVVEGEEGVFYGEHRDRVLDSPLLARLQELPNAIITPHMAYFTEHALRDTVTNTLINCSRFTQGAQRG